jgi:D-threo-aldose 1-dehydrogenase
MLETRLLGRVDLEVTSAGLGGGPLGNAFAAIREGDAAELLAAAWEDGIRFFDTAPAYGNGLSEMRIGGQLQSWPRDEVVVSTKVGCELTPGEPESDFWIDAARNRMHFDYSYDGTLRQLESSLERLRTDRIDVVFIHDVDVGHHGEDQPARFAEAMAGAYRALLELREQGVIKAIGVGVNETEVCVAAAEHGDFDCFLIAGRYTLLEQGALDDLMPICESRGIGLVMGGVFNSGILAKGARDGARYNYRPAQPEVLSRVQAIEAVCRRFDVPLGAAAAQFALGHPVVSSVLLGARHREQQAANHAFMTKAIPDELWTALVSEGLVRADAPLPSTRAHHGDVA